MYGRILWRVAGGRSVPIHVRKGQLPLSLSTHAGRTEKLLRQVFFFSARNYLRQEIVLRGMFASRSTTRTLRPPGIRHRHLPYHTIPYHTSARTIPHHTIPYECSYHGPNHTIRVLVPWAKLDGSRWRLANDKYIRVPHVWRLAFGK